VRGQIRKAISGFYYIYANGKIYQTRARGNFRQRKITPLVGDFVEFESKNLIDGYLLKIFPRKNELFRPTTANVDIGIIVISSIDPDFSLNLLDRFLVLLEEKKVRPLIYITKIDLLNEEKFYEIAKLAQIYRDIGYTVIFSKDEREKIAKLIQYFPHHLLVTIGQSGVGKSTLLNTLSPTLKLQTSKISKTLGQGKHTTRFVELLPLFDGLIADTPGFSSIDLSKIKATDLPKMFPEFIKASPFCKFRECSHTHEPSCEVKTKVEQGQIALSRYKNYLNFLSEIRSQRLD
jgi:ribosome biogenesis GTPase